jgi:hypothetical protein
MELRKPHAEVLCITPRRFGKTWGVAMYVAAMMLCVPGIKIGVFSTAQRVSTWFMRKVLKFILDIEGSDRHIVKQTNEELFLSENPIPDGVSANSLEARRLIYSGRTSQFYSFPSSVNSKLCVCVCVARVDLFFFNLYLHVCLHTMAQKFPDHILH